MLLKIKLKENYKMTFNKLLIALKACSVS